jgi:zinc protease
MIRATLAAAITALTLAACQPAEQADAALEIPALEYTERTLDNGLRVFSMSDATTASVSIQVWYNVGSKDDPPGRSGFAHLFEHLMFKSTANMPPETMDRLTEDAGGFNNASTWNDFTNYYETVPANHLQRVLWGEAERMGSLVVDEANFLPERDVVKEELRQNYLASPYGRMFGLYLTQISFDEHPYGRPGIGSIEQLDSSTIEDVREFHAAYYRPDNAIIVVSGNFNQTELDSWIDEYFGPIATPDREIPRVTTVEPERTAARDYTVYEPNVPLPGVAISWPSPAASASPEDLAAFIIMDSVFGTGQSSRLYQSVVYDQQLAAEAFTLYEITQHPGAFGLGAIVSDGKEPAEALAALRAEAAKMRDTLITEAELEEARNELITDYLDGRETASGRAFELAYNVTMYGDPDAGDAELAALQSVTPQDVQRIAQQIMDDNKAVTRTYLNEETQNGATEDTIADSPNIQATEIAIAAADIPTYTLAAEGERALPPTEGPPVSAAIPAYEERTLDNGLRVIVASKPGLPLFSANLTIKRGATSDPAALAGLASMTADVATRGTTTRSATDLAREIESLGAFLNAGSSSDTTDVSAGGRSDKAGEIFALMSDIVLNPAFAEEEIERARTETLDNLKVELRQPGTVASLALRRALFGVGSYGRVETETTINNIQQTDIQAYHTTHWRPDDAVLVIAGNLTAEEGFALAETAFGAWLKPETAALGVMLTMEGGLAPPRVIAIDIPDIQQAAVMMGAYGPARSDPDYIPTLVVNNVLGGGYSARLNAEIRIKRGLSYGAGASLSARMGTAPVVASAQTRNDAVPQVIDLMGAELARLGSDPIPEAELNARKAVLVGSFGRSVETTAGLASQLGNLAAFNLPLERLSTYADEILAVTPEQATIVAIKYYDPSKAALVVAGDAAQFWSQIQQRRANAERFNIDDVNFNSGSLK